MSAITQEDVNQLIDDNVQTYKRVRRRIGADYGNERKLTADYNGRQLLELLQNADDAKTEEISIELDEAACTLRICNNGEPFSAEGLGSLMIAGTSNKNKRQFIGNKGLGFRAVLNWVTRIRILIQECVLEFSPAIATREFERIVPVSERAALIAKQEDLLPGTSPFAVLAIPDFGPNEDKAQTWKTIIELSYAPDVEGDILEQLEDIRPEVLLFLNHTKRISISRNGEEVVCLLKTVMPGVGEDLRVRVNDVEWNIRDSGELQFPKEENKYYRYKIAWRDDLADKVALFYTFFPTRVESYLPCLIHGTFELTSDRNHLQKHPHNDLILGEIAAELGKLATTRLKSRVPDWKAYLLLHPSSSPADKWLTPFYERLKGQLEQLEVYPSADGRYYAKSAIVFYGNDFSEWVVRKKLASFFPQLLLSILPSNYELTQLHNWKVYNTQDLVTHIGKASEAIKNLKTRCELIRFLTTDRFARHNKAKYPLVLSDESSEPVPADIAVFLTKQGSVGLYRIPPYVKLRFIAPDFYAALIKEFAPEIARQRKGNEHRSRPLKHILGSVLNLGSSDITDVVAAITRAFNKKREASSKPETIARLFREYVGCLYRIFSANPERRGVIDETIYLRNRNGDAVKSETLYLGNDFPTGKLTESLFEGTYTDADYVAGNHFWQLEKGLSANRLTEEFFVWLGVNKLSRIVMGPVQDRNRDNLGEYADYVFKNITRPNQFTSVRYQVKTVQGVDRLLSSTAFSRERWLLWIMMEPGLRNLLQDDANGESFSYLYFGIPNPVFRKPSFFKYQLAKAGLFKDVFADVGIAKLLGLKPFNTENELFKKWGITRTQISETLRQLGVMVSLSDLTPDNIFKLLNNAGEQTTSPRNLYQMALAYFRHRDGEDFSEQKKALKVWAINSGERRFLPAGEVYYTDHVTLPEVITADFWMLDYPRKKGEMQVSKYLGVRTFKNLTVGLVGKGVAHAAGKAFQDWVETIKPYLLMYRLNNMREDAEARRDLPSLDAEAGSGNDVASVLKRVKINLVAAVSYRVNSGLLRQLKPGEFIPTGQKEYTICGTEHSSIDALKQHPKFCEAFAEIMCMAFNTQKNKEDFKAVFADRKDLQFTKYAIGINSLSDTFQEAQKMLGVSDVERTFWKCVVKCKGIDLQESAISREALNELLVSTLGYQPAIVANLDFERWANTDSFELLKTLHQKTGITLEQLHHNNAQFRGLEHWHLNQFLPRTFDLEQPWNNALWKSLVKKGTKQQEAFKARLLDYNIIAGKVSKQLAATHALQLEVNYLQKLMDGISAISELQIKPGKGNEPNIKNLYAGLLAGDNILEDELPSPVQSLLFFAGHDERITAAIKDIVAQRQSQIEPDKRPSNPGNTTPTIVPEVHEGKFGGGALNTPFQRTGGGNNRRPAVYGGGGSRDANKILAGKNAEALVRNYLKSTYPNGAVQWMSGFSDDTSITKDDTLGYDMRYKEDIEAEDWYFVEVKSVSQESFIITRNEVQKGLENKSAYQLAIIKDGVLYLDKHYFLDEERSTDFSSLLAKPGIQPLDFEVAWLPPNANNN